MADYTLKNLMDVEDSAPGFGYAPNLEARFASGDLELTRAGISYQRLGPDYRGPFGHKHKEEEEIYVILSGGGRVKLDDEIVELREMDALRVSPQTTRNFEAGPDGLELLAIGAPGPNHADAEVLPGWWADE